VGVCRCVVWY